MNWAYIQDCFRLLSSPPKILVPLTASPPQRKVREITFLHLALVFSLGHLPPLRIT